MRVNFGLRFWSILGTFWSRFRRHFWGPRWAHFGLDPGPILGPIVGSIGYQFWAHFWFIPGDGRQNDKVENDEAEHGKVVCQKEK